jgi:hypothetical protein
VKITDLVTGWNRFSTEEGIDSPLKKSLPRISVSDESPAAKEKWICKCSIGCHEEGRSNSSASSSSAHSHSLLRPFRVQLRSELHRVFQSSNAAPGSHSFEAILSHGVPKCSARMKCHGL